MTQTTQVAAECSRCGMQIEREQDVRFDDYRLARPTTLCIVCSRESMGQLNLVNPELVRARDEFRARRNLRIRLQGVLNVAYELARVTNDPEGVARVIKVIEEVMQE